MATCRDFRRLLLAFSAATCSLAQDVPKHSSQPAAATPGKVSLTDVSAVDVPALPADSIGPPLLCDPDGTILLRLATPEGGVEDPVSISKDGKTVVRFGSEKINDIPRPSFLNMFVNGSDIHILARGSIPLGYQDKLRTKQGEIVSPATRSSWIIAHFERDGTYVGAISLDLPFRPLRLGVFQNGDFLIAGAGPATDEPRVAMVASNGQLRRFVELKEDVHEPGEQSRSDQESGHAGFWNSRATFRAARQSSSPLTSSILRRVAPLREYFFHGSRSRTGVGRWRRIHLRDRQRKNKYPAAGAASGRKGKLRQQRGLRFQRILSHKNPLLHVTSLIIRRFCSSLQ